MKILLVVLAVVLLGCPGGEVEPPPPAPDGGTPSPSGDWSETWAAATNAAPPPGWVVETGAWGDCLSVESRPEFSPALHFAPAVDGGPCIFSGPALQLTREEYVIHQHYVRPPGTMEAEQTALTSLRVELLWLGSGCASEVGRVLLVAPDLRQSGLEVVLTQPTSSPSGADCARFLLTVGHTQRHLYLGPTRLLARQ